MKRLLTVLLTTILFSTVASAQLVLGLGYSGESFNDINIRGGRTSMSPHGVIAAAAWRIPLLAKGGHLLALEPGLAFSFSKASSMKIADAAGVVSDYKSDVFFSDVSLPVLATYGYTFAGIVAPYIALGPRLCYNIDTYSARESIYSGTSTTHFAIQAALGGGVTLWDHYRLGAYYCFGLFNREFRSEDRNLFPSNVVATFCYIF